MSYNSLAGHYKLNFELMQHHKYSLTEIESMIPFERDLYTSMLLKWLEEERERQKQRQS
jgi:hypothetical protein